MPNRNYPSDLTDSQWEHIKEMLPKAKRQRRPRELEMRQVVNAILYVVVGGIQWRMLPKDFPKWQSTYYYFRLWRKDREWLRLHDRLRAEVRRAAGRHKHPTAGLKSCAVCGLMVVIAGQRSLLGSRRGFASSCKWSCVAKNSLASSCYPVGGWSSAPSHGSTSIAA